MKRVLARILLCAVVLTGLIYLGDYFSLRFQIPNHRQQFGSVHIQPYLAVPRKDGKTEFILEDPVDQPCVYSLFPHFGDSPCWYLARQRNERENL